MSGMVGGVSMYQVFLKLFVPGKDETVRSRLQKACNMYFPNS